VANDKVYIHELIDVIGHNRARYMHHMTANWSPEGQEQRGQLCYGVWAVLGSTGRWPEVVNIWEHNGWDGLAASFGVEAVGGGAQDPTLEAWWAKAAELRRGGVDRILEPAPWTRTIQELCADGVSGACYAHEQVVVRNGAAGDFLERVREEAVPLARRSGWELAGAWKTAMVDDDECVLLWAIPAWQQWADFEKAHSSDPEVKAWRRRARDIVESWQRIVLVDAPLSPFRTGRQPSRDDRTPDWDA
jgi:NIPSNAP protein